MVKSYKKKNTSSKDVKKLVKSKKIYKKRNVKKVNTTKSLTKKPVMNGPSLVPKSNLLYSKNGLTGEETLVQTQQINGDKFKSFIMKSQSQIPPTIYKSNNGSTTFSMSKKRQMVVQSYSIGNKQ